MQSKNPRDPISWAATSKIPLPNGELLHYNPDIRAGMEKWHEPVEQPFGGESTFEWPTFNDRIHAPDGTFRPAYVCHMRTKVKYSNDKMWYIASFIRGMTVDEALKELKFCKLKGARIVEEVIEEAREMAVKEHHFEYATNMWVAESFSENFENIKNVRRHARMKIGQIMHRYITYFVRLEEGIPPEHYYDHRAPKTPHQMLEDYVKQHRSQFIHRW